MAINLNFNYTDMHIHYPGYDGPVKCPSCGAGDGSSQSTAGAYRQSGSIPTEDGSFTHWSKIFCFDCHYHEEIGKEVRDAYLKKMGRE